MFRIIFLVSFFSVINLNLSLNSADAQLYVGQSLSETSVENLVKTIKPGSIVVIGEVHGLPQIQAKQLELLNEIRKQGLTVSVGLEFLNFTDQQIVNNYRSSQLSETDFKTQINWGKGYDFNIYKDQILFPKTCKNETTLGLNIPGSVTKQIAKGGVSSLNSDQLSLLPLNFTIGNDGYKKRFITAAGPHLPADRVDYYFAAQSAWDDSMAATTADYVEKNQTQVFVVIVGEFHVQFGGGLPDRLKQRLNQKGLSPDIITVSQIWSDGLTTDEIQSELKPSAEFGQRSNFVWLVNP